MNPLLLLAQSEYSSDSGTAGFMGGMIGGLINLVILVVLVAAQWKIFTKAGKPGWAAIIPIYNIIVFLEIIGRPIWWIVLFLIPFVNIIVGIIALLDLAKSFGKSTGFAIGLILLSPIFLLILGFGDSRYQGPAAAKA